MTNLTTNQVVVNDVLNDFQATEYPGLSADDVFELFGATQALKPKELTSEEIAAGITDGDRDGGIDSFFVFLNGALLSIDNMVLERESDAVRHVGTYPLLEVFLVQSKNKERWEESTWEHLLASLPTLLDLTATDGELESLFRPEVVERTGILRRAILALAPKFPRVTFRIFYITKAPIDNVTPEMEARRHQVEELVRSLSTVGANVSAEHIGVERLYELAGTPYDRVGDLKFRNLLREADSYLGVVRIEDYLAFVRNDDGSIRDDLFDSNVRDFEGDNEVNQAIAETLASDEDAEFWWLNNGVTIIGDNVHSPQQTLTISRPLVVNGLQTSHVIHLAEREGLLAPKHLDHGIVVRVVQSTDEEIRDRIIAGTNRQTRVPSPALYATKPLQLDIERFLLVHKWYYERRKNRYKRLGIPARRRISMNLLSQALITLKLGQPDTARARPSTLLSKQEGYESIFSSSMDPGAYLAAIEIVKSVDEYLRTDSAKAILDDFTNARFYVTAGYAMLKLRLVDPNEFHFEHNFRKLPRPLDDTTLATALEVLAESAETYAANHQGTSRDTIFKSSDFRDQYFKDLVAVLS